MPVNTGNTFKAAFVRIRFNEYLQSFTVKYLNISNFLNLFSSKRSKYVGIDTIKENKHAKSSLLMLSTCVLLATGLKCLG